MNLRKSRTLAVLAVLIVLVVAVPLLLEKRPEKMPPIQADMVVLYNEFSGEETVLDSSQAETAVQTYNALKFWSTSKPMAVKRITFTFFDQGTRVARWTVDREGTACFESVLGSCMIDSGLDYDWLESLMAS